MPMRPVQPKERWQFIVFPLDLKTKGYDEQGYRYNVDPKRHLMRIEGNTPAIDYRALQWWSKNGVETIHVHLTDGSVMSAPLAEFLSGGHAMQYRDQGKQWVNRSAWVTTRESAADRTRSLVSA